MELNYTYRQDIWARLYAELLYKRAFYKAIHIY